MVLSKSFKTQPRKGLKVEIHILDKNGKPHDYCADHDVFAVEPGPFVVDVVVTGAAYLHAEINRHSARKRHKLLVKLKVDGHTLGRQSMHFGEKSHHKFHRQHIRGPDGVTRLHALVFDAPMEAKDGGATTGSGATVTSGDTGRMELQFVEVVTRTTVAPSKTSGHAIEAKAAQGSGSQDKKFFMQQGVAFKTGECIGTEQAHMSNSSYSDVRGGLDFKVDFLYDMKALLQLRGVVPYSDDEEAVAVAPKRRRTEAIVPGMLPSGPQVKEEIDLTGE